MFMPRASLAESRSEPLFSFWLPESMSPACWVYDFWDSGCPVEAAESALPLMASPAGQRGLATDEANEDVPACSR